MSTAPNAPTTVAFLSDLFAGLGEEYRVELRPVPGNRRWIEPGLLQLPGAEALYSRNWFFAVLPRPVGDPDATPIATCVWVDIDRGLEGSPADIRPEPSYVIHSGKGTHLYYHLAAPIESDRAVQLSRLAAEVFDADRKVCEPKRVMRLPGTLNHKYDPPRPCDMLLSTGRVYEATELLDSLIAALVARIWTDGGRHSFALGLGALLARASVSETRAQDITSAVTALAGDDEEADRLRAVADSYRRRQTGEATSVAELREALGPAYKLLVDVLGIGARDGSLLLDGEVIGQTATIERDLVELIRSRGEWAFADGSLCRWAGHRWRLGSSDELRADVFDLLGKLRVMQEGDERPFPPTARLARAVTDMCLGYFQARPLPDESEYGIPLSNGIYHVGSDTLSPHSRETANRAVMPVSYDPDAECPRWLAFIEEAAPEEVEFLQEWMGYALVPGNLWQKMLWLYGPSGTGKSTFLKTVSALLGPYCQAVNSAQLNEYTVAGLVSARVAVCSELSVKMLRTPQFKALVAGDPVPGRHPYGRPFSVEFRGKFIWSSNSLPDVDEGEGFWRRVAVVPFERRPLKPDVRLEERINAELPGVLNWALVGLRRLQHKRDEGEWIVPKAVAEIVEEYQWAADVFSEFVNDELILGEGYEAISIDLYRRYSEWCSERGIRPAPWGAGFWRALRKFGLEPQRAPKRLGERQVRMWVGAKLVPGVF